jgi:hypothetical protein
MAIISSTESLKMNSKLKPIEIAIIQEIVNEHERDFPSLKFYFPQLNVLRRESTGVGFYVNFIGANDIRGNCVDVLVSSQKALMIKGFQHEVTYVLVVSDGKFNCLEIVTNGDDFFDKEIEFYEFELI